MPDSFPMLNDILSRPPLPGGVLWAAEQTYHRLARLQSLTEGWQWILMGVVCLAILTYVVTMYRRDSVELSRGLAVVLILFRLTAFAGLLFYFFDLEKGTEKSLTMNSRAIVLVDLSQSMAERDVAEPAAGSAAAGGAATGGAGTAAAIGRAEAVAGALKEHNVIQRLREKHDVAVFGFGDADRPTEIASFSKRGPEPASDATAQSASTGLESALATARNIARVAIGLLAVAAVMGLIFLVARLLGRRAVPGESGSWSLLASMVLAIAGVVVLATAHLSSPGVSLLGLLGLRNETPTAGLSEPATPTIEDATDPESIDWMAELAPRGKDTRLGDALQYVANQERGGPISAIVLVSDGQGNAGVASALGAVAAQEANIPVFTVAVGGDQPPIKVRVVDLEAPQRVYPGDRFQLRGYVQAFGMSGRTVRVELMSNHADASETEQGTFEEEKSLILGDDGATLPVEFEVTPDAVGKRRYTVRVVAPDDDQDVTDNSKSANVDVVDEKNRVLLIAGGPTREYRFLRNMLFRDRDTTSAVLLQSGEPGISQEADELIFDFPSTEDELFEYDCIVAFDVDWLQFDELQIRLLERWVSEQAGGLIVVAGPVFTPEWSKIRRGTDARVDMLKSLYPVVFVSESSTTLTLGRVGGDHAWPLQFSRDGLAEKFLWLEDDPIRNEETWASFAGVYGYFAIRDVKRGTRVYARFSDPQEQSLDNEQPVYLAGHFYGSGRVFFQASGEMWRLRELGEHYFQQYYTKLLRWVSQGRLLRDSSRGVLLVDKERCFIGERVTVNAVLTDAQRQPLLLDQVEAALIQPDGTRRPLILRRVQEAAREGEYQEQFATTAEGDYRIELAPPESVSDLLVQEVRCSSSLAETRTPLRNDAVMQEIAQRTQGKAFIGVTAAFAPGTAESPGVAESLIPQDQETRLPGTPDRDFKRRLNVWLLALIAGVLSCEWLARRLSKLA